MRRWNRLVGGVAAAVFMAAGCTSDDGDPSGSRATETTEDVDVTETTDDPRDAEPLDAATFEGPITVGELSPPADPRPVELDRIGYVQEEFFASGSAAAYAVDGERSEDGRWQVTPGETAPYTTRLIVRRPADPAQFDGTVVVEWFNVSAVEAAPDWAYIGDVIVDEGAAWVGVSVQAFGVVGGQSLIDTGMGEQAAAGGGIKAGNPERYGSLEHPGDQYAFDIYSQVAAALRGAEGSEVIGGEVEHVIATGESQSAGFLTAYVNGVQPVAGVFDGFFVHSRGAGAARFDGDPAIRGEGTGFRIRDDIDVPVLQFETETDVGPLLRFALARQPDGPNLRTWEVAGTAHADSHLVGPEFPICPHRINDGPQHYVAKASFAALLDWVRAGNEPPTGAVIETGGADGTTVQRDDDGIALGGIRTPSVDVPVSVLSGEAPDGSDLICALFGSTTPFPAEELVDRYGSRDAYLATFDAALADAVDRGFVRTEDRDDYAAEARQVNVPG